MTNFAEEKEIKSDVNFLSILNGVKRKEAETKVISFYTVRTMYNKNTVQCTQYTEYIVYYIVQTYWGELNS